MRARARASTRWLVTGAALLLVAASPPVADLPVVVANDNRAPAGTLQDGVLTLRLVVAMARWYPGDSGGAFTDVPVFAEEGQRPRIPGPLIRVPRGTRLRVSVRNALPDSGIRLFGLGTPGDSAIAVAPGATHEGGFLADEAGTFVYAARSVPKGAPVETEQLAGALIVDAPGERTDDRVLVINIWAGRQPDSSRREALAINGRSWPHTERFDLTVGDSVRWRVVNASLRPHPMHLHGAYYRVDARGDGFRDTTYAAADRRMVVTELMLPRQTMRMTWSPEVPGNWLFHCHLSFHVIAAAQLDPPHDDHAAMGSADPTQHMAGLVVGISVRPRAGAAVPARRNVRRLTVHVVPGPPAIDTVHARPVSVLLARDGRAPVMGAVRPPSDLLVLTRGEPTDITVQNGLDEATAIHWHGLELESWSDGVPGWSGTGTRVAPSIAPGGAFTARLTLKRAGTFIYHTHLNDIMQLAGGLYGPLVVLEPGQRWNAAHDFIFVAGIDVTARPRYVVNGDSTEAPATLRTGRGHRFRFINIAPAGGITYEVRRDTVLAEWRVVAKDGWELSAHQAVAGRAQRRIDVGETFDAVFTPTAAGVYELLARAEDGAVCYRRRLVVRDEVP